MDANMSPDDGAAGMESDGVGVGARAAASVGCAAREEGDRGAAGTAAADTKVDEGAGADDTGEASINTEGGEADEIIAPTT